MVPNFLLNQQNHQTSQLTHLTESCSIFNLVCFRQLVQGLNHLKQDSHGCWEMISQELINGANDQLSKRLLLVVHLYDGHTVHRLR